jgi:hypothetical protein
VDAASKTTPDISATCVHTRALQTTRASGHILDDVVFDVRHNILFQQVSDNRDGCMVV